MGAGMTACGKKQQQEQKPVTQEDLQYNEAMKVKLTHPNAQDGHGCCCCRPSATRTHEEVINADGKNASDPWGTRWTKTEH
mmetsp:Transcript_47459/g.75026  ORF Transcript_47459/g.75026 Transcript_47459/m.75026 type:complete len:81 (+) Transcript_47459:48-290(+)